MRMLTMYLLVVWYFLRPNLIPLGSLIVLFNNDIFMQPYCIILHHYNETIDFNIRNFKTWYCDVGWFFKEYQNRCWYFTYLDFYDENLLVFYKIGLNVIIIIDLNECIGLWIISLFHISDMKYILFLHLHTGTTRNCFHKYKS